MEYAQGVILECRMAGVLARLRCIRVKANNKVRVLGLGCAYQSGRGFRFFLVVGSLPDKVEGLQQPGGTAGRKVWV